MRMVRISWVATLLSAASAALADGVPRQDVHFEFNYLTQPGQSVFVLGDIPELGLSNIAKSIKLVPGAPSGGDLVWRVDVAIPEGTGYNFRYVLRNDAVTQLSSQSNGTFLTNSTPASTNTPTPASRDLYIFSPVTDGLLQATFNTAGGQVIRPFVPLPGRPDLRVAMLPAQPNGKGISVTLGILNFATPLHTLFVKTGSAYNYEPTAATVAASSIDTFVIPTTTVPSTRTINGVTGRGVRIYLPRGYAQHTMRRYPVLYMHDGQNVFLPGGPFGCWRAEQQADVYIRLAQMREFLLVAVDNSSQRSAEYVPEMGNTTVDNDDYNSFLINELKPYVDANYRTLASAANTAVMGSSFGGIASLVAGMNFPGTYGLVGSMSTSFWAGNTKNRIIAGQLPLSSRLYLDCGDSGTSNDDAANTIQARDGLLAGGRVLNRSLFFQIGYGHQHSETYWNLRLPQAYQALFPITDEANEAEAIIPQPGDLTGDRCVNEADLGVLLAVWQSGGAGDADFDGDTDEADLGIVLANWGAGCQ
ncbi:MAG: alpha/beta hydrolase-fold protein [Phycisphaerae bacterium]